MRRGGVDLWLCFGGSGEGGISQNTEEVYAIVGPSEGVMSVATNNGQGLVCRKCGCRDFFVVYTRKRRGYIQRSRQCRHCGTRKTTWEREVGAESPDPTGRPHIWELTDQ